MDARLKALPEDFLDRLSKIFPPGQMSRVFKSYLEPKPTAFRINTLKTGESQVLDELRKVGVSIERDVQLPECFYFKNLSQKKITELSCFQNGEIYLQNFSSQIPAKVLNPKPHDVVLDLCASPGSKTTQMAALMKNQGQIIATEPDRIRYERLKHNTHHLGCDIIRVLNKRGESFCRQWLEPTADPLELENNLAPKKLFDKVLVDAPCSGDGTFYIHDKSSFGHWSLDFVKKIAKLQKKLLLAAISVTKPGGEIVYSTCSTSPEENECIVEECLELHPNITSIPISFAKAMPPLGSWNGKGFKLCSHSQRIYPSERQEGFFVAKLIKG